MPAEKYYTILTSYGKQKIAEAESTGQPLQLTEIAVGDGGGAYYAPNETQTALVNEVWRGSINAIYQDPNNPNWVVIEGVIPVDLGGFYVREIGVFDASGGLVLIGNYPETYKPQLQQGAGNDLYLKVIMEIANTSTVQLLVDPAIVLATRSYVDSEIQNSVSIGTSSPPEPNTGCLWYDTSVTPAVLRVWTGSGWMAVNTDMVDGKHVSDAPLAGVIPITDSRGELRKFTPYFTGFKNRIINGDFQIWQRGTSFTVSGYTADRWRYDSDTDDSVSISRQNATGSEPFVVQYFARIGLTAGTSGTYNKFSTRLEFPKLYFGKKYTLSFYAKADVSANITVKLAFVFSGTEYNPVSQSVNIGTTWQRYTITFTLGTPTGFTESGSDYLDVGFLLPVNTTITIDLANVQLEEGGVATDFEVIPHDIQLLRCMRYHETGSFGAISNGNNLYKRIWLQFLVEKRTTPTVTLPPISTDAVTQTINVHRNGVGVGTDNTGSYLYIAYGTYAADAEL